MLLNDSIIRCRYREGFDREVLMEPGTTVRGEDPAAADVATSSRAATGSASTSRRRTSRGSSATRTRASRSAGTRTRSSPSRRCYGGSRDAARHPGVIEWRAIPGGPFPMGSDPARAYPPDEDETPRRVATVAAFRIGRVRRSAGEDERAA